MADNNYKNALRATKLSIFDKLKNVFTGSDITDESYEEILETLILCDVGVECAQKITDELQKKAQEKKITKSDMLTGLLKETLVDLLDKDITKNEIKLPAIFLSVGVNGSGKTTSIAKIANKYKKEGKNVMLAAADTFRAAAVEQLDIWAKRIDVPIVKSSTGSDPAAVAYDALTSATARKSDLLIVDTAGRLSNKVNLMAELAKIYGVLEKGKNDFNLYTFITVDATSGLNALSQVEAFANSCKLDGIVISKIDGSSKGGIIIPILMKYKLPIWFVGTGEKLDDLNEFNAEEYVEAMLDD
ncbi:MAG: signal recognition particle-docking protein FtsY [Eubacteriaceae bacterium]